MKINKNHDYFLLNAIFPDKINILFFYMNKNIPMSNNTTTEIAEKAVKLVLGKENKYVQRLLINQLEGKEKQYSFTPMNELIPPQNRSELKSELSFDTNVSKQKAVTILESKTKTKNESKQETEQKSDQIPKPDVHSTHHVIVDIGHLIPQTDGNTETIDLSGSQYVSSWVINTILQEKLNYREVQEKAERRKNINAILATILPIVSPIVVELIRYYCFGNESQCSD